MQITQKMVLLPDPLIGKLLIACTSGLFQPTCNRWSAIFHVAGGGR